VRAFLYHLVHDRHLSRSTHAVYAAAPMIDGFALLEHLYRPDADHSWRAEPVPRGARYPAALAILRSGRRDDRRRRPLRPMERPEKVAAASDRLSRIEGCLAAPAW